MISNVYIFCNLQFIKISGGSIVKVIKNEKKTGGGGGNLKTHCSKKEIANFVDLIYDNTIVTHCTYFTQNTFLNVKRYRTLW